MTILFQAPNGVGLGHMNRLAAIALEIRRDHPDAKLPFVVEGQSHELLESLGIPWLSLPHYSTMYRSPQWEAWTEPERLEMMNTVADGFVDALNPDVIVFDCFPCFPVVEAAASRCIPIVLCVRQMRDMTNYFGILEPNAELITRIIFPHAPADVDVPRYLRGKAAFVGQIVRNQIAAGRASAPAVPQVVITGGAGGYPGTVGFYNHALQSVAYARRQHGPIAITLITGPLFKDWMALELVDGARMMPFDSHLASTVSAADLVICQAGYNTLAEVAQLSTPVICIPGSREFDDQIGRARQVAATSPHVVTAQTTDEAELAALVVMQLSRSRGKRAARHIGAPGAAEAARVILGVAADRALHRDRAATRV